MRRKVVGSAVLGLLIGWTAATDSLAGTSLPTANEFDGLLRSCATGANIDVKADLLGSITTLYRGDRTQGAANFRTSTEFLKLMPEKDRLEAYRLYTQCIAGILAKR